MFDIDNRQLELFDRPCLTPEQFEEEAAAIYRIYWSIRNTRPNRYGRTKLRRLYREVAAIKKRLTIAGVQKREMLEFLRHCRRQCRGHPACKFCSDYSK